MAEILQEFESVIKVGISHPVYQALTLLTLFTTWTYLASIITQNYSHVDKLWSIMPIIYVWVFGARSFLGLEKYDSRVTIMSILVTIWGVRLTYNFARKGGYRWHDEDYRWSALRKIIAPRILWHFFAFAFIAVYQNILIFLFSAGPMIAAWYARDKPFGTWDFISGVGFLMAWTVEIIADQQQWKFQTEKYRKLNSTEHLTGDYRLGFYRRGLFYYSRHPNFFGEITLWWFYYFFYCRCNRTMD